MGDDADQDALGLIDGSPDEETGEVYLGRRAPGALSKLDGTSEPQGPVERGPTPRALAQARIQVKSEPHVPRVRSSKLQPRRHVRTGPNPLLEDTPLTPLPEATASRVVPKTATLLPDLEEVDDSPPAPKRRRLL